VRARAPGKLVLSGAYSVLWGAPALVTTVDRHALADASRPHDFVPREIEVALSLGLLSHAPKLDVSELRAWGADGRSQKLGLGSSAALLVAALAAAPTADTPALGSDELLAAAVRAHRLAQGGGSGIDVAASALGGTLVCTLEVPSGDAVGASASASLDLALRAASTSLPPALHVECWRTSRAAVTASMVAAVRGLELREPATFARALGPAREGAVAAAQACARGDAAALVEALETQTAALASLGELAGAPIVPGELAQARATAALERAVVLPSGAGGGDVVLLVRVADAPASQAALRALGYERLELELGVRGAHRVE
jgi:phosphomevalonate kinase